MSKITKVNYDLMANHPDNIQMIMANSMMETVVSKSLITLHKLNGNKVKAQFSFEATRPNDHPLTYVFLVINGDITGSYALKPPVMDITTIKAPNVEWEM